MRFRCDACSQELTKPGALAFSPPAHFDTKTVFKYHVCQSCWTDHFVVVTAERWSVEHSFMCRLGGEMSTCEWHAAIERVADDLYGQIGRYRIDDIAEGLPTLTQVGWVGL